MQPVAILWTVLGIIIYIINCVLVSKRPKMGMEFGSTKRNRCWMSGQPMDSLLAMFWDY